MAFTTLNLTNERVLVKGTDSMGTENQTVLDSSEWTEVKNHSHFADATDAFNSEVEEFFKPLMVAAEKLEELGKAKPADPISYVTIHEGTEANAGSDEVTIRLSHDSIVLRLLESGDTDRLVWVGDSLEVLEVLDLPATKGKRKGK